MKGKNYQSLVISVFIIYKTNNGKVTFLMEPKKPQEFGCIQSCLDGTFWLLPNNLKTIIKVIKFIICKLQKHSKKQSIEDIFHQHTEITLEKF
jgi:hypothetical protein